MIETKRFSRLKFNEDTETLACTQKIKPEAVHPVGKAVKSRYRRIEVIYVPDESKAIDTEWFTHRAPKSGVNVFALCERGFANYPGGEGPDSVREEFAKLVTDKALFGTEAEACFAESGFPPFFELGSIVFVRKEDAVIYGGCLEDFGHLAEHGVDIAVIGDSVEFGGNGEFDHVFESAPFE